MTFKEPASSSSSEEKPASEPMETEKPQPEPEPEVDTSVQKVDMHLMNVVAQKCFLPSSSSSFSSNVVFFNSY